MKTLEHSSLQHQDKFLPAGHYRPNGTGAAAGHRILNALLANYQGPVAVRLWDNTLFAGDKNPQCIVHIHHPGVLRELILQRDLVKLAEAYIAEHIEVSGDLEVLFSLESHITNIKKDYLLFLKLFLDALHLPALDGHQYHENMKAGDTRQDNSHKSIAYHYDLSNDFYKLWLDPHMVYSCAYFLGPQQSLAHAQCDKLNYICRKLRLHPGQSLLDIGCGWGALICWAAKHYGVRSHGITLSQQQYRYAQERILDQGLQQQVTIELRDYRDMPAGTQYDRIASIGMFEHVGVKNFPQYFNTVKTLLKPGGLFLNHGITSINGQLKSPLKRFMNKYIFPDGELARISDVNDAMEKAGFEIIDVEGLRRHYALTLRRWIQALELHFEKASELTSVETYRLWRLYMSGCAYYFDEGTLNLHQILAGHQNNDLPLSLRRDDLYSTEN